MSRNIKSNFKVYNTSYMKTISKQTTDTQNDIDVSSFQTSNNILKKNNLNKTNIYTYTNNNNSNKRYPNHKVRIKNNSFKKFALFNNFSNNNNSKKKCKNNLYLFNNINNNNTLNNDSHSFSKIKKRIKAKTKDKIIINETVNIKPMPPNKTEINSLNISKNSKMKNKKEYKNINNESNNIILKRSNTSKILKIKIKNCHNNIKAKKVGNNLINNCSIKTNINSPLGSDREEKQIISLNHELTNKKNEINKLKERIDEQNKYINELEEKIKNIIEEKVKEDVEYEQYSKKMIVRNIKVLTNENEELHKQIDEYKEKEIKIMKALYYLNKQGISIDSFLDNDNQQNN